MALFGEEGLLRWHRVAVRTSAPVSSGSPSVGGCDPLGSGTASVEGASPLGVSRPTSGAATDGSSNEC
eukprot:1009545-Amphidinium_carterae.1